ncbi:DUF6020 family protein [Paenibacillus sp. FSL H8-0548]|uniref:DUF6020 family protein n=1 Tax=Paenibacillus sp. FSL H8-0548 TaxID=1920422 RepID=UPI0011806F74|nr:DUF6020 family protein [Paenibacillus sp. FSL H8-0548]
MSNYLISIMILIVIFLAILLVSHYFLSSLVFSILKDMENKKKYILLFISMVVSIGTMITFPIDSTPPQKATLKIKVVGDKNIKSNNNEVWVNGVYSDNNKINVDKFKLSEGWEIKDNKVPVSFEKDSLLEWGGFIKQNINVFLLNHEWSGIVEISINEQSEIVDLYSLEGHSQMYEYQVSSSLIVKTFFTLINFLALSFFCFLFIILVKYLKIYNNSIEIRKVRIFVYSLIISSVYSLYLLAYYPGTMSSDSIDQWNQVLTESFNDAHPIVHTLFIWLFTRLWLSPAIIAIIQLILMSLLMGYSVYYLEKLGLKKMYRNSLLAFYSLSPTYGIMSITIWKDIPFSISIAFLTVLLVKIYASKGQWLYSKTNQYLLIAILISVYFFRHNGVLSVVGSLIVLIIFYRNLIGKLIKISFITFVLIFGIKFILFQALALNSAPSYLSLSLPIHQIGTFVHENKEITEDEKRTLEKIMPIKYWDGGDDYSKYTINYLIFNGVFNGQILAENKSDIVKTWLGMLIRDPKLSISDFFSMTSILWRVHQPDDGYTSTIVTNIYQNNLNLDQQNFTPKLKAFLDRYLNISLSNYFLWFFWRPAFTLYTILFFTILIISRNSWKASLILIPILSQIAGISLVIPAQDSRYLFYAFILAPFLILLSLHEFPKDINTENIRLLKYDRHEQKEN